MKRKCVNVILSKVFCASTATCHLDGVKFACEAVHYWKDSGGVIILPLERTKPIAISLLMAWLLFLSLFCRNWPRSSLCTTRAVMDKMTGPPTKFVSDKRFRTISQQGDASKRSSTIKRNSPTLEYENEQKEERRFGAIMFAVILRFNSSCLVLVA